MRNFRDPAASLWRPETKRTAPMTLETRESKTVPTTASPDDLTALIAHHGTLVYRLAVATVHDHAIAEDVVQDVMIKAWNSMPSWDGDIPVRWLRVVTRNTAIDVLRRRRFDDLTGTTPEQSDGHDPERIVEGREHLAALWQAIALLDPDARSMLVLRETERLSYEDIADLFDITTSAVKAKLYRTRHALRRHLEDWDS